MIYDAYVRLQEKSTTKNSVILFFGQKITKSILYMADKNYLNLIIAVDWQR